MGGQQPSIVPSSVGQQSPLDKPMARQAEFFEQEAATAWGALMVLFDDLQHHTTMHVLLSLYPGMLSTNLCGRGQHIQQDCFPPTLP